MTHAEPSGHGPAPAVAPHAPFAPEEVAALQKEDLTAARMVVGEMLGIFSIGVILYVIVLISCL
jgi:hypothetical protein